MVKDWAKYTVFIQGGDAKALSTVTFQEDYIRYAVFMQCITLLHIARHY